MITVTAHLSGYVEAYRRARRLTFAELQRQTEVSWMTFKRICDGTTGRIGKSTALALCKLFDLSMSGLTALADTGVIPEEGRGFAASDPYAAADTLLRAEEALELWEWARKDRNVLIIVRALGYKGRLPVCAARPPPAFQPK